MGDPGGIYRPGRGGAASTMKSGTLGAPGMSFSEDTTTGFYWQAPDIMGLGVHGYAAAQFSSTSATIPNLTSTNIIANSLALSGPVSATTNGTAMAPVFTNGALKTGLYFPTDTSFALSANGTQVLTGTTTLVASTAPIRVPNGSLGNCSFGFTNSVNTGLFSTGIGQVTLSAGGVSALSATSTALTLALPLTAQSISAQALSATGLTAPSLVSPTDATTGLSFVGSTWVLKVANITTLTSTNTLVTANASIQSPNGTAALTSYGFTSSAGSGLFLSGTNTWGLAAGGTLTLSGSPTVLTAAVPLSTPVGSALSPSVNVGSAGLYQPGSNSWGLAAGGILGISGTSTEITSAIPFGGLVKTANKTASYTILASESGRTFDCVGASATVTYTLPAATAGQQYTFVNSVALLGSGVTLKAAGTDTIRISGTSSAGGTQTSTVLAATVTLTCINAGKWVNTGGFVGLWVAL